MEHETLKSGRDATGRRRWKDRREGWNIYVDWDVESTFSGKFSRFLKITFINKTFDSDTLVINKLTNQNVPRFNKSKPVQAQYNIFQPGQDRIKTLTPRVGS